MFDPYIIHGLVHIVLSGPFETQLSAVVWGLVLTEMCIVNLLPYLTYRIVEMIL